jgi:predicted nucleic acid-binding Zn ribbon protein
MAWTPAFNSQPFVPARSPLQRVLAEWRGVDLKPLEVARQDVAHPINETVTAVLKNLKLDQRRSDAEVLKVWNHSMAPDVVAHAQPAGLAKGTLFINVDNSVWLGEIVRYRRREILQRLQHSFGKDLIARISFRIG